MTPDPKLPTRQSVSIRYVVIVAVLITGVVILSPAVSDSFAPTLTPTPTRTRVPTTTSTPTSTATPTATATATPTPAPVPTDTPTPVPTKTPAATPTDTPTAEPAVLPSLTLAVDVAETSPPLPEPDCAANPVLPPSAIGGQRLLAYYGTPAGRGLGILGRYDMATTLSLLNDQAEAYRVLDPCVDIVLVFHMVTTIADAYPGDDGDYNHRVSHDTIRPWIDGIAAAGGLSILDIQPGRASIDTELSLIEPLVRLPGVHLAIDPEFIVTEGEIPGTHLGKIDGETINLAQVWLNSIAEQVGEHKILVIHQFDDRMMENKDAIQDYPLVNIVWDADGFGGPGAKIGDYIQYWQEPGFEYGGIKLFYNYDTPVMTPEQVMGINPPPAFVVYQ